MAARRAKFVTFEGMEGSGKTTQLGRVGDHYAKQGKKVFVTREPGGTPLGNEIRSLLLKSREEPIDPWAELFLMEAARAQHVARVVAKMLPNVDLILCDRFTDATVAYQGGGRGLDRKWIDELNHRASFHLVPDLTVLLDMPVTEGLKRALARIDRSPGEKEDRFERETRAFHERVRETYLSLARAAPDRFFIVDAAAQAAEITRAITRRLDGLFER